MRRTEGGWLIWCPGCESAHFIPDAWHFNGDLACPSFSPSVNHPGICHYTLTSGVMRFDEVDTKHKYRQQSVALPELPDLMLDFYFNEGESQ